MRKVLVNALRETAQAMDIAGMRLQNNPAFAEKLSRHRRVMALAGKTPVVEKSSFIAPSASVMGQVELGEGSSVWYNSVVRGDVNYIKVGKMSNLQDRTTVHAAKFQQDLPTIIGDSVTVENGAVLHACVLESEVHVGACATVLDGAVVRSRSVVAPGALVTPGTTIPSGQLWGGAPAKYIRDLTAQEQEAIAKLAEQNCELARLHAEESSKVDSESP
eukprot:TRINITY_DN645_c0_g1_i1.p1 TRINITY_DN645_c0_g1~~TRINITY_DN645_c0_g1_i1.p1  ORF type:complete len:242 (-),score=94.32 TRINITY_DN645_c0_g1_i1:87-740(-)